MSALVASVFSVANVSSDTVEFAVISRHYPLVNPISTRLRQGEPLLVSRLFLARPLIPP